MESTNLGKIARHGTTSRESSADFGEFEFQERPTFAANQGGIVDHVDGGGIAPCASRRGIGRVGGRIGRQRAIQHAAFYPCYGFKRRPAIPAHVIEAAVRGASVKHLG